MKSVPYWDFKQRRMTIYYRYFGGTYQFIFQMSNSPRRMLTLEEGPICCPETSLRKYHSTLRHVQCKRRSQSSVFWTAFEKEPLGNKVDGIVLDTVHCTALSTFTTNFSSSLLVTVS